MSSSAVELRVLGALELRVDGHAVPLGGPVPQAVLAVLVCADGAAVPVERLLREVWPDTALRPSRKTLAAHVSRLRRALPADVPVEHVADAYRLAPLRTDAQRFSALLAAAREAADPAAARTAYVDALGLWRGEPYAGVDAGSVAVDRVRLGTLVMAAREELGEVRLALGEPGRVVEDLADLATADPPRERALAAYVTALHRTGRRTQALDVLRRGRRALGRPGRDLTVLDRVEEQLLRDEDVPAASAPVRRPPTAPPVPVALSSFVGREALLDGVPQRLERARWLTLVGPAGVGKTRLALELLHRTTSGEAALVQLAPLADGGLVGALVGEALGMAGGSGTDLFRAAASALGPRPFLLVVDNCEHLRDAVVPVVTGLLSACPRLQVLATSREALGSAGEHVLDVPALAVVGDPEQDAPSPAVQLFLDRLVESGWTPDDADLDAVRRICAELDGLPLALELAAARCRTLSPQDVAAALSDRFGLLHAAGPASTPHHASLRAAVAWSYELLDERAREHFRALTVFEGGFELDAARALLGSAAAAAVADLAAKSLLTVDRDRRPRRYGTLVSLREYAATVTPPAEREQLRRQHLAWAAALARDGLRGLLSGEAAEWVERLERERANLRAAVAAAVDLGEQEAALGLVADLGHFWYRSGHAEEGVAMLLLALREVSSSSAPRARALVGLAHLYHWRGQLADAVTAAVTATDLAGLVGDRELEAEACVAHAWAAALLGDLADAEAAGRRALAAAEACHSATQVSDALSTLGLVRHLAGDWAAAEPFLHTAVESGTTAGNAWSVAVGTWLLARVALRSGRPEPAARHAVELAAGAAGDGNRSMLLLSGLLLAACLAELDRPEQAGDLLAAVEGLCARTGQRLDLIDPHDAPWLAARARAAGPPSGGDRRSDAESWGTAQLALAISDVRDALPLA